MASSHKPPRHARLNINGPKNEKSPVAIRPPGGSSSQERRNFRANNRWAYTCRIHIGTPDGFAPIQRVWPGPRTWRLVQSIAGTDKIVGGSKVVGGIRHHGVPTDLPGTRFQRTHQAQSKATAAMPFEHADAAEISRVMDIFR